MDLMRWWRETHDMHGFRDIGSRDEAIARVATRLGGVVDREQLDAVLKLKLPMPHINHPIGAYIVDFFRPSQGRRATTPPLRRPARPRDDFDRGLARVSRFLT